MTTTTLAPLANGFKAAGTTGQFDNCTFGVEFITPAEAEKYLQQPSVDGFRQRPAKKAWVKQLATQMKSGEWFLQYEPIILADTGFLIEGQHRMMAVVESDTPQTFLVVRGADESLIDKINSGSRRTGGDIVSMNGKSNSNSLAAVLKDLWKHYDLGGLDSPNGRHLPNYKIKGLLTRFGGAEKSLMYISGKAKTFPFVSVAILSTLHYIMSHKSHYDANLFFAGLTTGAGLKSDSPIYVLRNKLEKIYIAKLKQQGDARISRITYYALIIKGWNAFRLGKSVKRISFAAKEKFPQIL